MSAVSITERRLGGGAVEIGIRRNGELVAVITHPCAGADWFIYPHKTDRERFKTKREAIERASTMQ